MPKNRVFTISIILLSFVVFTSCRSKPIIDLPAIFVADTPTLEATSTATPLPAYKTFTPTFTPNVTNTPTPTPTPPVNLKVCAFAADCPEAKNILEFINVDVLSGSEHEVDVPVDTPLYFRYSWTAIDEETLAQNMKAMNFFFDIDGQSYKKDADIATGFVQDSNDSSLTYPAAAFGYILEGWQIGVPHTVHIGFTFLEEIFDGWETYPAGTLFEVTYIINPVLPPTATNTPIPQPTAMPQPTAIPPTATVACELGTSIFITNDTGGQMTIYLSGPAEYSFNIAAGSQTINLCSGQYSYTAYGCGNASTSGTAGDGDEIEFWCE